MAEIDREFLHRLGGVASESDRQARARDRQVDDQKARAMTVLPDVAKWLDRISMIIESGAYLDCDFGDDIVVVTWVGSGEGRSLEVAVNSDLGLLQWRLLDASDEVKERGTANPEHFERDLQGPLVRLASDSHWPPPKISADRLPWPRQSS